MIGPKEISWETVGLHLACVFHPSQIRRCDAALILATRLFEEFAASTPDDKLPALARAEYQVQESIVRLYGYPNLDLFTTQFFARSKEFSA